MFVTHSLMFFPSHEMMEAAKTTELGDVEYGSAMTTTSRMALRGDDKEVEDGLAR